MIAVSGGLSWAEGYTDNVDQVSASNAAGSEAAVGGRRLAGLTVTPR
jgi:hypothetical protein